MPSTFDKIAGWLAEFDPRDPDVLIWVLIFLYASGHIQGAIMSQLLLG